MVIKMTKNLRTVKATFIIGILLVSISASIASSASAENAQDSRTKIVGLTSYVIIDWGEDLENNPIKPRGELRAVKLDITYGINVQGLFSNIANIVKLLHLGRQANIQLEVIGTSPWCTASISQGATIPASVQSYEKNYTARVNIQVEQDAPAFALTSIKIKVSAPDVGLIAGYEEIIDLNFVPQYIPKVQPLVKDTNTKRIGPMDTVTFPIEIENMGNARTLVKCEVEYVPEGWVAIIDDSITLEEGVGTKAIVYLTVRPPKGFGYHDEDGMIRVKVTPSYWQDTSLEGSPETVSVLVESRGFSVIGIEMILLPLIVIIAIILFLYYGIYKKKLMK